MSEQRWRANLMSGTLDKIEIVNETLAFVDVRSESRGGWAGSIRREAKVSGYSEIHKSEREAWQAIVNHLEARIKKLKDEADAWTPSLTNAKIQLGKLDVSDTP